MTGRDTTMVVPLPAVTPMHGMHALAMPARPLGRRQVSVASVEIESAGRAVKVESDDPLAELAAQALLLWRKTSDARPERGAGAIGFTSERSSSTEYVPEFDVVI